MNTHQSALPNTDEARISNQDYQNRLGAYQQQMGQWNGVIAGLMGLGGRLIGLSGRLAQKDIKNAGEVNGMASMTASTRAPTRRSAASWLRTSKRK